MQHVNVSASQFSTFNSCRRAWAFDKIDKVPRVESVSANEGTSIHAEVENFYLTGEAPKRPESMALMLHLPSRELIGILPEQAFSFVWPGQPALVRGFMDLWQPNPMSVWDHKTTSSKRYFKTTDDLVKDAQAICYGFAARALTNNLSSNSEVSLQWTYVVREQPKTRPPLTEAVKLKQTWAMLEDGIAELNTTVSEIVQISRTKTKAVDVEPSPGDACFRYGGCPYRDLCPDYAGHKQKGLQMPGADLLALLRAASNEPVVETSLPPLDTPKTESVAAPTITTAPVMPPMEVAAVSNEVVVQIVPPDAQPNVSRNDPPVPPQMEVARRGRPKTTKAAVSDGHAGFPSVAVPTPPANTAATQSGVWRDNVIASLESVVTELIRNKKYEHAREVLFSITRIAEEDSGD